MTVHVRAVIHQEAHPEKPAQKKKKEPHSLRVYMKPDMVSLDLVCYKTIPTVMRSV